MQGFCLIFTNCSSKRSPPLFSNSNKKIPTDQRVILDGA